MRNNRFQLTKAIGNAVKKGARRPLILFFILMLAAMGAAAWAFLSFQPVVSKKPQTVTSGENGLFNAEKVRGYQSVFLVLGQRQKERDEASVTDYSGVFRELPWR